MAKRARHRRAAVATPAADRPAVLQLDRPFEEPVVDTTENDAVQQPQSGPSIADTSPAAPTRRRVTTFAVAGAITLIGSTTGFVIGHAHAGPVGVAGGTSGTTARGAAP